jgi:serine/threonine protein kinase
MHADVKPENIMFRKRKDNSYDFFLGDLSAETFSPDTFLRRPFTPAFYPTRETGYTGDLWALGFTTLLMLSSDKNEYRHNKSTFASAMVSPNIASDSTVKVSSNIAFQTTAEIQRQFDQHVHSFLQGAARSSDPELLDKIKASTHLNPQQRMNTIRSLGVQVSEWDPLSYWCNQVSMGVDFVR